MFHAIRKVISSLINEVYFNVKWKHNIANDVEEENFCFKRCYYNGTPFPFLKK